MEVETRPGWYIDQRSEISRQLNEAMELFESRAGANTGRPRVRSATNAALTVLTAMSASLAGPIALIGLSVPMIKQAWEQGEEGGSRKTYFCGQKLLDQVDQLVRKNHFLLFPDQRWDEAFACIEGARGCLKTLQAAANAR
ncbi:hypothetical protein [Microbacterium sp.]|uniref:hypothetical protein n=1 Tax=Microbacterium sp. TaxID=51671 RepID=UPI0031FEE29B